MNLGDLRQFIAENGDLSDDMPVILQEDAEGNGYSPLSGAEEGWYEAESTWSGNAIHEDDYDPEDYPDAVRALILWPVN